MSNRHRDSRTRNKSPDTKRAGLPRRESGRTAPNAKPIGVPGRPTWSGVLILLIAACLAGAAGFGLSRLVRRAVAPTDATHALVDTDAAAHSDVSPDHKPVDSLALPDGFPIQPNASLPDSAGPLRAEVTHLLDHLLATFPENPVAVQVKTRFQQATRGSEAEGTGRSESSADKVQKTAASGTHERVNHSRNTARWSALRTDAASIYAAAGRVYYNEGAEPYAAEVLWLRAANLDPQNVASRQLLAWLYKKQRRFAEAILWLREAARLDAKNPSHWLEMGQAYEQINRIEDAVTSMCRAIDIAPHEAANYAALASLQLRHDHDVPAAVELAKKAIELAPTAANHAILAAAADQNGDRATALNAIGKAMKLAPDNAAYGDLYRRIKAHETEANRARATTATK